MINSIKLLIATTALVLVSTEAKYNACGTSRSDIMAGMLGFNQGFQHDDNRRTPPQPPPAPSPRAPSRSRTPGTASHETASRSRSGARARSGSAVGARPPDEERAYIRKQRARITETQAGFITPRSNLFPFSVRQSISNTFKAYVHKTEKPFIHTLHEEFDNEVHGNKRDKRRG